MLTPVDTILLDPVVLEICLFVGAEPISAVDPIEKILSA